MEGYSFFYGSQMVEFERPEVPEIIAKDGIKTNIVGGIYSLKLNASTTYSLKVNSHKTKVVVLNVYN